MGYIRNHAIVVSYWDEGAVRSAHAVADKLFSAKGGSFAGLVSPVLRYAVNDGASFFISPDGSKEGWSLSDDGDDARAKLIEYLRTTPLWWAEIILGGDDDEYVVTRAAALPRKEGE